MRRIVTFGLAIALVMGAAACQPKGDVVASGDPTFVTGAPVPTPADEPSVEPSAEPSVEPSPTEIDEPSPSPSKVAPSPSKSPSVKPSPSSANCAQGEHQKEVEAALAQLGGFGTVSVDGVQSAADCSAIKKFQKRFDIRPAYGRAGPLTYQVAKRLLASSPSRCKAGEGLTACVDLTNQTVWLMKGGKVVYGPTVTRTGFAGYATPTGTYSIHDKALRSWSNDWDVWLPYWQRIVRGIGFHQTTTYIHNMSLGSHGCVNLLPTDAVKFYEVLQTGTPVKIFGQRAGT